MEWKFNKLVTHHVINYQFKKKIGNKKKQEMEEDLVFLECNWEWCPIHHGKPYVEYKKNGKESKKKKLSN